MSKLSGKLAIILHADVADSTELVQQDKELAHERIRDSFRSFEKIIESYDGRVLELRGDALLASFERVSEAISAALAFQSDQSDYLGKLTDEIKPVVRIGLAMGEVIIADNTVTGSGVIQAQRVEQLSEPGKLCITASIHEALSRRLPVELKDLGEQSLKGLDHPVRVYQVSRAPGGSVPAPSATALVNKAGKSIGLPVIAIILAMILIGGGLYWFQQLEPPMEVASVDRMALPLPEKPSIAVLPFDNMSANAEQEYFVDGMTEDLITDLSKIDGLFVIARNTVFTYKGKDVNIGQVAEELGVRYVLEGSVRRSGNQVRINAQLIDALSGGHVWADRYDGVLDDVFKLQDEVTHGIVSQLAVNLKTEENAAITHIETADSKAYDLFLKGWEIYRTGIPENYGRAIALIDQAIEKDPAFERALASRAAIYWKIHQRGWGQISLGLDYYKTFEHARIALRQSEQNPTALTHQIAAEWSAYYSQGARLALEEANLAIGLDPNHPASNMAMAVALLKDRRFAEAEDFVNKAIRLDPNNSAAYLERLAQIQFHLEKYPAAASSLEKLVSQDIKNSWAFIYLAATYGQLNQAQMARSALEQANKLRAESDLGAITQLATSSFDFRWRWHGNRDALKAGLKNAGAAKGGDWYTLIVNDGPDRKVEGAQTIDAVQAKTLHDSGAEFVDIQHGWFLGRIPGAHFLEWWGAEGWKFNEVSLQRIAEGAEDIVIYNSRMQGGNSGRIYPACAYAASLGIANIHCYVGGIEGWEAAGFPVDSEEK